MSPSACIDIQAPPGQIETTASQVHAQKVLKRFLATIDWSHATVFSFFPVVYALTLCKCQVFVKVKQKCVYSFALLNISFVIVYVQRREVSFHVCVWLLAVQIC